MEVIRWNLVYRIIHYRIILISFMAKGKSQKYKLVSLESGKECGYIRLNPLELDKTKKFKRFDNNPKVRKHVDCKIAPIKKGGTKALANSQKEGE